MAYSRNAKLDSTFPLSLLQVDDGVLFVVSGSNAASYNIATGRRLKQYTSNIASISALLVNGDNLYTGSIDGSVRMFNVKSGEQSGYMGLNSGISAASQSSHTGQVNALHLEGPLLFSAGVGGPVRVFDTRTLRQVDVFKYNPQTVNQPSSLVVTPEFVLVSTMWGDVLCFSRLVNQLWRFGSNANRHVPTKHARAKPGKLPHVKALPTPKKQLESEVGGGEDAKDLGEGETQPPTDQSSPEEAQAKVNHALDAKLQEAIKNRIANKQEAERQQKEAEAKREMLMQLGREMELLPDKSHNHNGAVKQLKTTPDGQWVVTCSVDRSVRVWHFDPLNPLFGRAKYIWRGDHPKGSDLYTVAVTNELVVSYSTSGTLVCRSLETGKLVYSAVYHDDSPTRAPLVIAGNWLILATSMPSGSDDVNEETDVPVISAGTGNTASPTPDAAAATAPTAMSKQSSVARMLVKHDTVSDLKPETQRSPLLSLEVDAEQDAAVDQVGQLVKVVQKHSGFRRGEEDAYHGRVRVFQLDTGTLLQQYRTTSQIQGLTYDERHGQVYVIDTIGEIDGFDLTQKKPIESFSSREVHNVSYVVQNFKPISRDEIVATIDTDPGAVVFLNRSDGRIGRSFIAHDSEVSDMIWCGASWTAEHWPKALGMLYTSGDDDVAVKAWVVYPPSEANQVVLVAVFDDHRKGVRQLALAGNWLITASHDRTAKRWYARVKPGDEPPEPLEQYPNYVKGLCVDSTLKYLYLGTFEHSVRKVALIGGKQIGRFRHSGGWIMTMIEANGMLWLGTFSGDVVAFFKNDGNPAIQFRAHVGPIRALYWSEGTLWTAGVDQNIKTWDPTQELLLNTYSDHFASVLTMMPVQEGRFGVWGTGSTGGAEAKVLDLLNQRADKDRDGNLTKEAADALPVPELQPDSTRGVSLWTASTDFFVYDVDLIARFGIKRRHHLWNEDFLDSMISRYGSVSLFLLMLGILIVDFVQLLSFAFQDPDAWKSTELVQAMKYIQSFGFIIVLSYRSAQYMTLGLIAFFLVGFSLQEGVERRTFLYPDSSRYKYLWLVFTLAAKLISRPLFLPLFNVLAEVLNCDQENYVAVTNLASSPESDRVRCWSSDHVPLLVSSAIGALLYVPLVFRFLRVGAELNNIQATWNFFNWDYDRFVPHQQHGLSFNENGPMYFVFNVSLKVLLTLVTVLLVSRNTQLLNMAVAVLAIAVVIVSYRYPPFFGHQWNRIRSAVDWAVLCTAVFGVVAASTPNFDEVVAAWLVCLLPATLIGYYTALMVEKNRESNSQRRAREHAAALRAERDTALQQRLKTGLVDTGSIEVPEYTMDYSYYAQAAKGGGYDKTAPPMEEEAPYAMSKAGGVPMKSKAMPMKSKAMPMKSKAMPMKSKKAMVPMSKKPMMPMSKKPMMPMSKKPMVPMNKKAPAGDSSSSDDEDAEDVPPAKSKKKMKARRVKTSEMQHNAKAPTMKSSMYVDDLPDDMVKAKREIAEKIAPLQPAYEPHERRMIRVDVGGEGFIPHVSDVERDPGAGDV